MIRCKIPFINVTVFYYQAKNTIQCILSREIPIQQCQRVSKWQAQIFLPKTKLTFVEQEIIFGI